MRRAPGASSRKIRKFRQTEARHPRAQARQLAGKHVRHRRREDKQFRILRAMRAWNRDGHRGFAIDLQHWPRALVQTTVSASNSVASTMEQRRFLADFHGRSERPSGRARFASTAGPRRTVSGP